MVIGGKSQKNRTYIGANLSLLWAVVNKAALGFFPSALWENWSVLWGKMAELWEGPVDYNYSSGLSSILTTKTVGYLSERKQNLHSHLILPPDLS